MRTKNFSKTVSIRLSATEKETLDDLCRVLNVTKSEFLRKKVFRINEVIKNTPAMKNLEQMKAAEKAMQELMGKTDTVLSNNQYDGETPSETTEGLMSQMKKQKERSS